ncbi:MAG: SDR family NAD(P)-dependent oxidoreductase [Proteobacteria bacterium]|nr:SDR family NAD(P)-dependent oxidoreductase [Pseudomonadota bacterium]MBU1715792.1 SDR family NAD(P)-dependent oxidoreductase [Pseudomonadota bacterium]
MDCHGLRDFFKDRFPGIRGLRDILKLVVVTGISRGLGLAFYQRLTNCSNCWVVGIGRSFTQEQLDHARDPERRFQLVRWDLAKPMQQEKVNVLLSIIGEISQQENFSEIIYINNAAIVDPIAQVGCLEERAVFKAVSVNFMTPIFIANRLVRFVEDYNKKLKIINMSTGAAKRPIVGWSTYCSCKAGAAMFFDVMAKQFAGNAQFKICQVDPGVLDTDMQMKIRGADVNSCPEKGHFVSLKRDGRLLSPDDVAAQIVADHIL